MQLHPLSALAYALQRGFFGGTLGFFLGAGSSAVVGPVGGVGLTAILAPLGFLAGAAYGVAYYSRFAYELTADTLDISAGVVSRKEREIPYRRVQNVDLSESLFHRIAGVAVVRVETAGGSSTEAELNFVGAAEARRVQREIRSRRAELRDEPSADDTVAVDASDSDAEDAVESGGPTPIFSLAPGDLLVLSASSFHPGSIALFLFTYPFIQDVLFATIERATGFPMTAAGLTDSPNLAFLTGLFVLGLAVVGAWLLSAVGTFLEYYGFTLGRQGEDLVYERGLLQRYSGSIPTDKIQTLTVTENVLMRLLGYAGLAVETAGYSPGQGNSGGSQAAIPLAQRAETVELARELEAFPDASFTRPPRVARRRYAVRYLLVVTAVTAALGAIAALVPGFTLWLAPLATVPLIPVAAHLKWRNRGYHAGEDYVVFRDGFWRRTTRVVPYYRLQTVIRERTIFQRRLGLAHLTADTATSSLLGRRDATAYDIDADDAGRLYDRCRDRLQTSLGGERASEW